MNYNFDYKKQILSTSNELIENEYFKLKSIDNDKYIYETKKLLIVAPYGGISDALQKGAKICKINNNQIELVSDAISIPIARDIEAHYYPNIFELYNSRKKQSEILSFLRELFGIAVDEKYFEELIKKLNLLIENNSSFEFKKILSNYTFLSEVDYSTMSVDEGINFVLEKTDFAFEQKVYFESIAEIKNEQKDLEIYKYKITKDSIVYFIGIYLVTMPIIPLLKEFSIEHGLGNDFLLSISIVCLLIVLLIVTLFYFFEKKIGLNRSKKLNKLMNDFMNKDYDDVSFWNRKWTMITAIAVESILVGLLMVFILIEISNIISGV